MWQYSSTGRVAGIDGDVDMNLCFTPYGKGAQIPPPDGPTETAPVEPQPSETEPAADPVETGGLTPDETPQV